MPKIDKQTEQRILDSAKVTDVLRDHGIELYKRGASLLGLCPFHADTRIGSFVVNERRNYYKCFACDAKGDAVKALRELDGLSYPDALRYLAAMYNIYIDDEPRPVVKKYEPRKPLPPTVMTYWDVKIVKPYLQHENDNNLLRWMLHLPLREGHLHNLRTMIQLYCVGTSTKGATIGWTVFPQIDQQMRVRDIKLMAYKEDGHRNKELRYSFNWMHSMMAKANMLDEDKYHVEHCLFGLHLAAAFPKAEICLVESEKSAIICSAFSDPNKRIWMATGGKSGLNPSMLQPLIDAHRYIVLYPDCDGYEEWTERMEDIDYPRLSISQKVRQLHIAADGDKADIADIMVRMVNGIEETEAEKVARRVGATSDQAAVIADMMNKLDLQLND